ncbi:DUF6463 family protein [Streptomyces sp. LX-29]|uniref:DUF6463 family protein n=1 Tax=Streptomyces sp. LX-29 TaxID=2900152 RepID=UPI00240D9AEA|nr:DUF6463 family protein [Streptomyces sp. LX-29]WFB06021.1 DUF6463 family protein [Streptomyces sp. LX-29]
MNTDMRLLRWAGALMTVLGTGHLVLLTLTRWGDITDWVDEGAWAAVPLSLGDAQTVADLESKLAFWGGPGSFGVPLVLLGCLTWHLAGRGVAIPAGIGWGVVAWCAVGGVLLVPSPFFAGIVPGVLVIVAARRNRTPELPGCRG